MTVVSPRFLNPDEHWIQKRRKNGQESEGRRPMLRKHLMKNAEYFKTHLFLFFCASTIYQSDTSWRAHRRRE